MSKSNLKKKKKIYLECFYLARSKSCRKQIPSILTKKIIFLFFDGAKQSLKTGIVGIIYELLWVV